jgi:hypothetical protein
MMLEEIVRRQEDKRKMLQDSWLSVVHHLVAGVLGEGAPKADVRMTSTVGVHILFDTRERLLFQKKRWGFRTYRDVVYTAMRIGLESLESLEKMSPQVKP